MARLRATTSEDAAAQKAEREMHQNPEKVLADGVVKASSAGAKVAVACKIGVAYIDLQIFRPVTKMQDTQTGPREVREFVRQQQIVRVRGTAYPRGTVPTGYPARPEMWNGFAITFGIDKEFWELYEEQNRNSPFIKNGLLIADEDQNRLRARTLDGRDVRSSIDPVTGDNDTRMPKPNNPAISDIKAEAGPRQAGG